MSFVLSAQLQIQKPNLSPIVASIRRQLRGTDLRIANVNQISAQFGGLTKSVDKTAGSVQNATNQFEKFGKEAANSIRRFGAYTVATVGFFKFVDALQDGIGEAIEFNRELVKVQQVTGKSLVTLGALTNEITRLSTTLGVSSKELLGVSRVLSQAGLSAKDTKIALEALALSDLAPTFTDMETTVEGAIAAMSQFKLGAEDLKSVLGSLNSVAGQFAVESDDFITAIRKAGGAFEAAGGNLNELLALMTSVRATTRESADSIATGFRTIFTRLQRPTTLNFLEDLGIKLRDLDGLFVGPNEAIRRISQALSEVNPNDAKFAQITEELGGFRQVSKVIPLVKQNITAQRALAVAMQGTESLTKDAETALQSLAQQIKVVKEEFIAFTREVVEGDTFNALAKGALNFASGMTKVATTLERIAPILFSLAAVGGGGAALGFLSGFAKDFGSGNKIGLGTKLGVGAGATLGGGAIITSILQDFGALDSTVQQVTKHFTSAVLQIGLFTAVLGKVTGIAKQRANVDALLGDMRGLIGQKAGVELQRRNATTMQDFTILTQQKRQIQQEIALKKDAIRLQEQAIKRTQVANAAFATLAAGAIVAAGVLQDFADDAKKGFESGDVSAESFRKQSVLANIASGAANTGGSFAAFGGLAASSLGPVAALKGAAIGGAIGSVVGGIRGGIAGDSDVDKTIALAQFNKLEERFVDAFERLNKGDTSARLTAGIVKQSIAEINKTRQLSDDPDVRNDAAAAIKGNLTNLAMFQDKVVETVTSLDEFIGVVGRDTIDTFARFSKIDPGEFLEGVRKSIQIQAKSRIVDRRTIDQESEMAFRRNAQTGLSNAANVLSKFSDAVEYSTLRIENLGDQALATINNPNMRNFSSSISQVGKSFGATGEIIAKDTIDVAKAMQILPNILLDLANTDPFGRTGDFRQNARQRLQDAGVGPVIVGAIEAQLDKLIGAEQQDVELINRLRDNFKGTLETITNSLEGFGAPLAEAEATVNDKLRKFADGLNRAAAIQNEYIQSTIDSMDLRAKELRTFGELRGNLDFGKLFDIENNKIRGLAGNNKLDPQAIAGQIRTLRDQAEANNRTLAQTSEINQRKELVRIITEQNAEADRLTNQLKGLADVTSRVAVLQEALAKVRERREAVNNINKNLVFADDARAALELRENISNIARLFKSDLNIEAVPQGQRQQLLQFLESLGDKRIGGPKGIPADKLIENILKKNKAFFGPGKTEKKLEDKLQEVFDTAKDAQTSFTDLLGSEHQIFLTNLNTNFSSFLSNLRQILTRQFETDRTQKQKSLELQQFTKKDVVENARKAQKLAGGVDISTLQANFKNILQTNKTLGETSGAIDFINKQIETLDDNRSAQVKVSQFETIKQNLEKELSAVDYGIISEKLENAKYEDIKNQTALREFLSPLLAELTGRKKEAEKTLRAQSDNVGGFKNRQRIVDNSRLIGESLKNLPRDVDIAALEQSIRELGERINVLRNTSAPDLGGNTGAQNAAVIAGAAAVPNFAGGMRRKPNMAINPDGTPVAPGGMRSKPNLVDPRAKEQEMEQIRTKLKNLTGSNVDALRGNFEPLMEFVKGKTNVFRDGKSDATEAGLARAFGGAGKAEKITEHAHTIRSLLSQLDQLEGGGKGHPFGGGHMSVPSSMSLGNKGRASGAPSIGGASELHTAINNFSSYIDRLEGLFKKLPTQITLKANHTVEVIVNGAEVMNALNPQLQSLVVEGAKKEINRMLQDKFPEVGTV